MSLSETNAYFRVSGGIPLSGEITPQDNKNEALPLLAASSRIRRVALVWQNAKVHSQ